jgi:hypothetical protein
MPFFDENQPYGDDLLNGRFASAVDKGLALLERVKGSDPAKYATPKGTPFYLMGIAAFASHDYQTATFFFDAAVAEDVKHYPNDNNKPALKFMRLVHANDGYLAADPIVDMIVTKLEAALRTYAERQGKEDLTLAALREHFLDHLQQRRPQLRSLTTTFVSFLAEWDYRLKMIDLTDPSVSREPFFTHLFRGCLLFESLLKENPAVPVSGKTLGPVLDNPQLKVQSLL